MLNVDTGRKKVHESWKSTDNPMTNLISAVTALKFIKANSEECVPERYLFAAIGNQVHVFIGEASKPSTIEEVFPNEYRIHGFSDVVHNRMIIYGGRIVGLVHIDFTSNDVRIILQERTEFNDWVWGVHWLRDGQLVVVACGHSTTYICDAEDLERSFVLQSEEKELTWSTTLFTNSQGLRAVAGSSFGDVLSWTLLNTFQLEEIERHLSNPQKTNLSNHNLPVHRLCAHDGPVMRLTISKDKNRLATASVDRSVRVWHTRQSKCAPCSDGCFTPLLTHYGHLARVWDVQFIDNGVVSVGEDHSCRVWGDKSCMETACYHGHAGRNIWSVSVYDKFIATGGEDGGVMIRSLDTAITKGPFLLPLFENPRKKGHFKEGCRSIVMLDSVTVLVTTDFGRILKGFVGDDITWIEVFVDDVGTAFTPCSLEVCEDFILAGQTNGNVIVLREGCLFGNLVSEGMVMGLFTDYHDGCDVFISSGNGVLSHWHIGTNITNLGKYRMKRLVKSSLVTAACFARDKNLVIVGDRGGRILTYDICTKGDTTYPKYMIHAHKDRVSCIQYSNNNAQSSGFDGAIITLDVRHDGSVEIRSVKRAPDRTDTISKFGKGMILGFRGSEGIVWGLDNRIEYLRDDIGNWRRAHDVNFKDLVIGYWRGGGLYIKKGTDDIWGSRGGHGGRVSDITIFGDNIMSCGEDGVCVWYNKRVIQRLSGHTSFVHGITAVGDGVVSVGGKDEVLFWEVVNGVWRRKWCRVMSDEVGGTIVERCLCVGFLDGIVVGRSDGSVVRLFDDKGCEELIKVGGSVLCMDCYNGTIVVGDSGGVVTIVDGVMQTLKVHDGGVNAVVMFDNLLLTGGDDGCVKCCHYDNGEWRMSWCGIQHTAAVTGLAKSEDDDCIFSVGADQRVVKWSYQGNSTISKTAIVDASSILYTNNTLVVTGMGIQQWKMSQ